MPQPDDRQHARTTGQGRTGLALQVVLVAASVGLVATPPAAGAMLIVPLLPSETATTVRWALAADARLVAPGPFAGSIIVDASRSELFPKALAHGALLVTTRFANCGKSKVNR